MPVQAPCGGSARARTGGRPRSIRGDLALASARDAPSGRSRPRRCRLQPAWPPGSRGLAPSSVHVQGQRERQAACGLAPRASRHRFSCGSRAWDPRGRTEPTRGGLSRSGDCKLPSHTPRSGSETGAERRRGSPAPHEARFPKTLLWGPRRPQPSPVIAPAPAPAAGSSSPRPRPHLIRVPGHREGPGPHLRSAAPALGGGGRR